MASGFFRSFKSLAGVFLMILNAGFWINRLFIHRERSMDIALAIPLFVTGAFLIQGWYKTSGTTSSGRPQRYKFILGTLMINYVVMYLIYVVADMIYKPAVDFLTLPWIILPLLLGLFITGFILSWSNEAYAGLFFILWHLLVIFGQLQYRELFNRGPYMFIGIVIFIQGILYLHYHFKIKKKV